MTPPHGILHIQRWQVCKLHHFKTCYFGVLLTFMLNFDFSASPANAIPMLIVCQWAHTHIFFSLPPLNDMVCSIIHNFRHVHKYTMYELICLSAMNLKYLLCISCIGCIPIQYGIQELQNVYKREVHTLYITKSCMIVQGKRNYAHKYLLYILFSRWKQYMGPI